MRDSIQALALVQKEVRKLTEENIEFLAAARAGTFRSEEHTSELQSLTNLRMPSSA